MAEKQIQSDPGIRRTLGRSIGMGIVIAAAIMVVVALVQWEIRPQTDDATVRANFVGIAPQVNGHIVELHVRDNQLVNEGDLEIRTSGTLKVLVTLGDCLNLLVKRSRYDCCVFKYCSSFQ